MENEKVEKILEVKIDTANAIKSMADLKNEIDGLKAKEAELNGQIKELSKDEAANAEAIRKKKEEVLAVREAEKSYSAEMRTVSTAVQNQLKADGEQVGSLKALRAELSNATREYDSLSRAEREGAKGQELKAHINEITDELKGAEEATQRYYRNVGNYENAIKNALGVNVKFADSLKGGVKGAAEAATQSVKNLGAAAKANPLLAIVTLLVVVFDKFKKGVESSEEKSARFGAAVAGLKPIADVVTKAIQGLADAVLWVMEKGGKVLKWLGLASDETERYTELEQLRYDTKKRTDDLIVEEAKAEAEVSDLRSKAKQMELYTDEERLAFVQQANEIEKKLSEEKVRIAEDNFRILQEEAKATENNAEINTKLKEAEAAVYRERKAYSDKSRELIEQENTIKNEIAADDKARHEAEKRRMEEQIKKRKEYNDLLLSEQRKAEDALLELISDNTIKLLEQEDVRYQRMVDDLAKAIEEKRALYGEDAAVVAEYQTQLVAAEIAHQRNVEEIQRQASEQHIADVRADIEREMSERRLGWENRIAEARLNGEDYNAIELEMLQSNIDTLHQYEEESDAEFRARQLEAQKAYLDKKKQIADSEIQVEQAKASAIASLTGSLSGLLNEFGEENKELAAASKILALAQIAIETGVAIAKGVAAAQSVPYPANIAAVASTIATVLANITSAVTTVKSAKFAAGGRVTGPGTSTSDSIPAMLSNGEYVLNARAYAMFPQLVEAINAAGSSAATPARVFNTYNTVSRAAAAAGADSGGDAARQTIVVSVEEINRVQDRVKVIENLSKIN